MKAVLLTIVCLHLIACESVSWLWQAANGQWELRQLSTPLASVLEDKGTAEPLRERLELVRSIVAYGSGRLGIADNPGYDTYVDLPRQHVVWNVFAVPEFSIEPRHWCFPIAGCVSYRGYFSEQRARRYAARLEALDYDVWVGGVAAYSTLGWFNDPVLSTWLWREESAVAALLFHELAHRRLYVPGDTRFNESLATLIEESLLQDWLKQRDQTQLLEAYRQSTATRREFSALVEKTWRQLADLYQQKDTPEATRRRKTATLAAMQGKYALSRTDWPEPDMFDSWIEGSLNNARLLTVLSYNGWLPSLRVLLAQEHNQLPSFLAQMETLAKQSEHERARILDALINPAR